MRRWRLPEVETPSGARSPGVPHSEEGSARAVLIELKGGEALGDHRVKESELLLVLDGGVRVEAGDKSFEDGVGTLFHFEWNEEHSVTSDAGARLSLPLAPWPGEGHYRDNRSEPSGVSASWPLCPPPEPRYVAASGCTRSGRARTGTG